MHVCSETLKTTQNRLQLTRCQDFRGFEGERVEQNFEDDNYRTRYIFKIITTTKFKLPSTPK